ncbi:MAG: phosphate acyltransferase PlsX [Pseudomonadota bacterium]
MTGPLRGVHRRRDGLRLSDIDDGGPTGLIAVDAMGADADPRVLVDGVARAALAAPRLRYALFGDAGRLAEALEAAPEAAPEVAARVEIRHAPGMVSMADKPSDAIRRADGTSMAAALDCVASGEAAAAVSSGNTGALMALATLRLGRVEGVARPAIAVLWPTIVAGKQTIVLDVGADVKMDARNLAQCASMGSIYAGAGFGVARPRVGLLNIGSEAHKGLSVLREAGERIAAAARSQGYEYVGFIEANDIPMDVVDVAVTDGFTGNVALKAAEGTARLIQNKMRETLKGSPLAMLGGLLAYRALKDMKRSMDPRAVNGGVFLGVRGAVVKSHGSVDAIGFAAALGLATRVGVAGLSGRLAQLIELETAA